jgi:hypothetical protein
VYLTAASQQWSPASRSTRRPLLEPARQEEPLPELAPMRSRAAPQAPSPIPQRVRLQVHSLQQEPVPQAHSLLPGPPVQEHSPLQEPLALVRSLLQEPPALVRSLPPESPVQERLLPLEPQALEHSLQAVPSPGARWLLREPPVPKQIRPALRPSH